MDIIREFVKKQDRVEDLLAQYHCLVLKDAFVGIRFEMFKFQSRQLAANSKEIGAIDRLKGHTETHDKLKNKFDLLQATLWEILGPLSEAAKEAPETHYDESGSVRFELISETKAQAFLDLFDAMELGGEMTAVKQLLDEGKAWMESANDFIDQLQGEAAHARLLGEAGREAPGNIDEGRHELAPSE